MPAFQRAVLRSEVRWRGRVSERSILVDSRAPTVFNAIISLARSPLLPSIPSLFRTTLLARSSLPPSLSPHFSYFRLCGRRRTEETRKNIMPPSPSSEQRIRPGSIVLMLLPAPNRVIVATGSHITTSHHPLFIDSIIGSSSDDVEGTMDN